MELNGRVAIVTGAAGGIGAALTEQFLSAGAKVVLTDLDDVRLRATADRLSGEHHGAVVALAGDAASADHIAALLAVAEQSFGRPVDIYAANAGVGIGNGLEASDEDWATSIDVNLMAHVRAARAVVPQWVERGEGYFLSTASAAGLLTQIGSPTYSATKHAAVAFSEWLSVTYGDSGVRVSCLCPMGVDTALLRSGGDGSTQMRAVTTAGPVLTPEEVARTVIQAMDREDFLILPHPQVLEMFGHKASDYDRWLRGMRRYQQVLTDAKDTEKD